MNIADKNTKQGASTKRATLWRGISVGFNQKRTVFFKIENLGGYDSNGGHVADVKMLTLSPLEREEVLETWRQGKAAWYLKHSSIPLRGNAEAARRVVTARSN